jgi:hypothetical protein
VVQVDLKFGDDVRLLTKLDRPVYGIVAAPPCTVFANSGARWPRSDADMREGLSIVDACLRAVVIYQPVFWALENPVGKLKHYLGEPRLRFHPYYYGDPYTKLTCVWGDFNIPERNPVEPSEGSKMWARYGGKSERTKEARSITPAGFAEAFFTANR